jgi:hypothetical protein
MPDLPDAWRPTVVDTTLRMARNHSARNIHQTMDLDATPPVSSQLKEIDVSDKSSKKEELKPPSDSPV